MRRRGKRAPVARHLRGSPAHGHGRRGAHMARDAFLGVDAAITDVERTGTHPGGTGNAPSSGSIRVTPQGRGDQPQGWMEEWRRRGAGGGGCGCVLSHHCHGLKLILLVLETRSRRGGGALCRWKDEGPCGASRSASVSQVFVYAADAGFALSLGARRIGVLLPRERETGMVGYVEQAAAEIEVELESEEELEGVNPSLRKGRLMNYTTQLLLWACAISFGESHLGGAWGLRLELGLDTDAK
ncbi:hypothetical protein C8R44DRAFT_727269 [Mycena epipterygia]|nr:hypothetical protein C8R44DRAFT_727269 [Mycena epipterygia]